MIRYSRVALIVGTSMLLGGGGGYLAAQRFSPVDSYAEEILACHALRVGQALMLLRYSEPSDIPRRLETNLSLDALHLGMLLDALPDTDPTYAHRALGWIRSYRTELGFSDPDTEIDRQVEELLASLPAEQHPAP